MCIMAVGKVIGSTKGMIQVKTDSETKIFKNEIMANIGDFVLVSNGKVARRLEVEYA